MPPKFCDPQPWTRYRIGLLLRASGGILTDGAPGRRGIGGLKSAALAASLARDPADARGVDYRGVYDHRPDNRRSPPGIVASIVSADCQRGHSGLS